MVKVQCDVMLEKYLLQWSNESLLKSTWWNICQFSWASSYLFVDRWDLEVWVNSTIDQWCKFQATLPSNCLEDGTRETWILWKGLLVRFPQVGYCALRIPPYRVSSANDNMSPDEKCLNMCGVGWDVVILQFKHTRDSSQCHPNLCFSQDFKAEDGASLR